MVLLGYEPLTKLVLEPLDHSYSIVFVINTVSLKADVRILQAHPMTW